MKSLIRKSLQILAGLSIVVATTLAIATPAQAAACYNKGNYSFRYMQSSTFFYYIDAWGVTGCSGSPSVRGEAYGNYGNQNAVRLYASDERCDGYGFVVYTNVKSVASDGCGSRPGVTITFAEIRGHPYNFWLNWHGVNSNAHTLPPMAP